MSKIPQKVDFYTFLKLTCFSIKIFLNFQDQLSAMCATPPHLEGATLKQIPLGSLNCDGNVNKINNANVFQQLDIRSKQTNLTYDTAFSDEVC